MKTKTTLHAPLAEHFSRASNVLADGTMWSHAAVLGDFTRGGGGSIALDAPAMRSFAQNFAKGYPKKVPVDYEHETVFKDPAHDAVPYTRKAGDVIEVIAVLAIADLNAAMQKQIADETARRTALGGPRATEPVNPLGLWIRWQPTTRALALVREGEVSEMSITFMSEMTAKDGEEQGPTLLSVALTNTPFLDEMIPVAATRGTGGSPAAPADQEKTTMSTSTGRIALLAAVLAGRAVLTEEDAEKAISDKVTELKRENADLQPAKQFTEILSREIGETDPAKALEKVKSLKADVAKAEKASKDAKTEATAAKVEAVLLKHEKRIPSVKAREMYAANLSIRGTANDQTKAAGATATTLLGVIPLDQNPSVGDPVPLRLWVPGAICVRAGGRRGRDRRAAHDGFVGTVHHGRVDGQQGARDRASAAAAAAAT
jgi:hypothetical protein